MKEKNKFFKLVLRWLILIAMLAAACQTEFIYVFKTVNGREFAASYPIRQENWDHPRLQLLRSREKLDQVVAKGETEFDKIVLLRKWAHAQWSGGDSHFYYPPWDAVEILDLVRQHNNRPFCAQYAIVFLQACLSMGIPARYVDLPGHFVVCIWSNEHAKWVIMDPTNDFHFERAGVPLNGRALCKAYWKEEWKDINKVSSDGTKIPVNKDDLNLYRMFSVVLRNNHLSEPELVRVNGVEKRLTLQKNYTDYPYLGKDNLAFGEDFLGWKQEGAKEYAPDKTYSDDPDDFRYPFNQTIIEIVSENKIKGQIKIKLRHENSPTFQTILSKVNDGLWVPTGDTFQWILHPGLNKLSVRVQTRFGWLGKESSVQVFYKKKLFLSTFNK